LQVKAANPAFGVADIAKELGAMWRVVGPKEKKKYEDLAREARARYEVEKAQFEAGQG
jgi:hypothetical protein